ncbi:branched-chain amino acid ABC transporter permease [Desulfobacula sp.]|uniref:branched-chain amino acid ABC transporter permease n=1 Tax=Desulfobacula sp. TaxID=2593537 RepID=UPI0026042F8C|nr:branched-chain amino acid ABC transporter permease [Desulfobacula sp.]
MFNKNTMATFFILIIPIVIIVIGVDLINIRLLNRLAIILCINMILVLGLQSFMGNSGILSFAHIGFMGVGAYTSALLAMPLRMKSMALPDLYLMLKTIEISPYLAIFIGGLVAALLAATISYPLMRLSDAAAVITSFALLVVLHTVMVHWSAVTNGPRTLFGIKAITDIYLAGGVAIVMLFLTLLYKESRYGLLLRAVRDDQVAASAIGANLSKLRWIGFIISAFMAGIAGGIWAHFITSFSPNAFYLKETFVILGMLVIGGTTTVTGAVIGTIAVSVVFDGLRAIENMINMAQMFPKPIVGMTEVVLAIAMIATLILRPGGITGSLEVGCWPSIKKRLYHR